MIFKVTMGTLLINMADTIQSHMKGSPALDSFARSVRHMTEGVLQLAAGVNMLAY